VSSQAADGSHLPKRKRVLVRSRQHRQLAPRSSVEHPAAGLRRASAPLFVEVGNAFGNTPISDITDPGRVTSPVPGAALATCDDPVQALKVERVDGTEQRLGADEADGRRHLAQVVRPLRRCIQSVPGGLGSTQDSMKLNGLKVAVVTATPLTTGSAVPGGCFGTRCSTGY
jgi:hypothetical protein